MAWEQLQIKEKSVKSLYTSIIADGVTINPSVFGKTSSYFFTYTIRNLEPNISSTWRVTLYAITIDGTTIIGVTGTLDYSSDIIVSEIAE